jgi:hypothetical protein
MASLIRLKQIESGSSLEQAASVGSDFSSSVYEIIDGAGLISSSAQVLLISASGYNELTTDIELSVVSGAVATTIDILESSFITTSSFNSYTQSNNISIQTLSSSTEIFSSSLDSRVDVLEQFSSSLDNGFATDVELAVTTSNLNIDMGEF